MKPAVMLVAVVAGALAVAGCGGDSSQSTAETATVATTPATTAETTTTDTTTTASTPSKPTTITVVVKQGRPQGGIQRPTVKQGDNVVLVVRTDSGEAVHLHGYDIEKPVTPGTPVRISFTAKLPGRFEVELHPMDALLAVIEVRP
jgi:ABC-type glycerol-3-phosphate transport system substrate-binding protein